MTNFYQKEAVVEALKREGVLQLVDQNDPYRYVPDNFYEMLRTENPGNVVTISNLRRFGIDATEDDVRTNRIILVASAQEQREFRGEKWIKEYRQFLCLCPDCLGYMIPSNDFQVRCGACNSAYYNDSILTKHNPGYAGGTHDG